MARKILSDFDPAVDKIMALSTTLPSDSYCQNRPVTLSRTNVVTTIRRGIVVISDDEKAAALAISGRVTWFLCSLDLIPTSGKELLDVVVPLNTDVRGTIANAAIRTAIHTARPDITVEGNVLTTTDPTSMATPT